MSAKRSNPTTSWASRCLMHEKKKEVGHTIGKSREAINQSTINFLIVNARSRRTRREWDMCRYCCWMGHAKFISSTVAIHEEPGCSKMQQDATNCKWSTVPLVWKKEPTLIASPKMMSIPLLSESAMILERLSRNLKSANAIHGSKQLPAWVPEQVNGIHDRSNPAYSYRGKSLLPSLQWKYCWAAGRRHTHYQPVLALPHVMDVIVILQKNTAA